VPLYGYELCEGRCETCGGRFAVPQTIGAAALAVCPRCRLAARKIISLPNGPLPAVIAAGERMWAALTLAEH